MSEHHEDHEQHEEIVRDVACGDRDAGASEVRALEAECATCRAALERIAAAMDELSDAARAMGSDLAAAEHETGAPGEARVGEMLARARDAGARDSRGDMSGEQRGSGLRPRWLASAAAVLLLGVVWLIARAWIPSDSRDPLPLGAGLECVAPVGEITEWGTFAWRGELRPAAWFEVVVRDTDGGERLRSGRLVANEFEPTAGELAGLPETVRWEVVLRDVARVLDRAEAEARRR